MVARVTDEVRERGDLYGREGELLGLRDVENEEDEVRREPRGEVRVKVESECRWISDSGVVRVVSDELRS